MVPEGRPGSQAARDPSRARAREVPKTRPNWAPALPLKLADCEALAADPNPRLRLLGWWSVSLYGRWGFRRHPGFKKSCRASMAVPWLPPEMRQDELLAEFPPKPLDRKYRDVVLVSDRRQTRYRRGRRACLISG